VARDRAAPIARIPALLLVTVCALGCYATYQGTSLHLPPATSPPPAPELVIAIAQPEIRLDARRWNSWGAVPSAVALANALRATGRFAHVDFGSQLGCEPDVVLVPVENPNAGHRTGNDPDDAWILLALGVIPVIESWDRGHYFVRRDVPSQTYVFPWERVEVLWWGSGPLSLLPGWRYDRAPDSSNDAFTRFLDQHWSELFAGVTPRRDPKCLAR